MSIRNKPLDTITEADLLELASNPLSEQKPLEIKSELPGRLPREQKEFLSEVASFANAAGGDLVFGMQAGNESTPSSIGLPGEDVVAEKQRIESLIHSGIEPQIPGLNIHSLEVAEQRYVFILRIPRSVAGPHWVKHGDSRQFYSRTSAGKYLLSYSELRDAFTTNQTLIERLRSFRVERLGRVLAGETTVPLKPTPKTILHVLPCNVANTVAIPGLKDRGIKMRTFASHGYDIKYNFDGAYTHDYLGNDEKSEGYFQLFRNGGVEVVSAGMADTRDGIAYLPSRTFEEQIIRTLAEIKTLHQQLGIEPPFVLMLSLLGVKGYCLAFDDGFWGWRNKKFDRDDLLIPEVMIESAEFAPSFVLKPSLDIVWNAAGYERSFNYDAQGNWKFKGRGNSNASL